MSTFDSEGLEIYHNFTNIEKLKQKIQELDYTINNLKNERSSLEKELDSKVKEIVRKTYGWE
jgi:predicted RNase H-like nuclease (RuvC/YqgF family)